jgi:uncharacterized protein YycO
MSFLDQFKMASEMMKNMKPEELSKMMEQAKESKHMMEDMVKKIVAEEIKARGLVSKEEVEKMMRG